MGLNHLRYRVRCVRSYVSRTRDLMLKRDTTSSLSNICCDIIHDIIEVWSMSSLSFTRDVIQDITRVVRKPWSLSDLGENLNNDTFSRLLLQPYDWLSPRIDMLSSLHILQQIWMIMTLPSFNVVLMQFMPSTTILRWILKHTVDGCQATAQRGRDGHLHTGRPEDGCLVASDQNW